MSTNGKTLKFRAVKLKGFTVYSFSTVIIMNLLTLQCISPVKVTHLHSRDHNSTCNLISLKPDDCCLL